VREPTDAELEGVDRPRVQKAASYFVSRIETFEEDLERERKKHKITEGDMKAVWHKYKRAKDNLSKVKEGMDRVDSTISKMRDDLKVRRKRWRHFRKHIAEMTNLTFGEMLNKKGSSGLVEFDHKNKSLGLTVQKDSNEASQTSDVKALSGGERSFTTLSLLLALGENLETPFRVMDEFDVFLDAVSRKIALTTLVEVASAMVHRQFIFITPQDLSRLTPGPNLKIIKMRAPDRGGGVQTTLD